MLTEQRGYLSAILIIISIQCMHQGKGQTCIGCKICVEGETGHSLDLNGVYNYHSYDATIQGSRYYNAINNKYLYPWTDGSSFKWFIGDDYTTTTVNALATIPGTPAPSYVFDVEDTLRKWQVYNGGWINDPEMIVVDCTTFCVSNNYYAWINGRYLWQYFNTNRNTSIYYCSECNSGSGLYLYGWKYDTGTQNLRIGSDANSAAAWCSCYLGTNMQGHFQLAEDKTRCEGSWKTYYNSAWNDDTDMVVNACPSSTPFPTYPTPFPIYPTPFPTYPTPFPTSSPENSGSCHTLEYSYSYESCHAQCASIYGQCSTVSSNTFNGDTTCHCCNCGTDNGGTSVNVYNYSSNNNGDTGDGSGCETVESGAVENPVKRHVSVVYIFLAVFLFVCVIPLWFFAFKCRVKTENENNYGFINKFVDIIDENGNKRKCCKYLRWQHSCCKLCCGTKKNRILVWTSFLFDNVAVLSLAILLASISADYHATNCNYSNGTVSQQYTSETTSDASFETNFKDTVVTVIIKTIYGLFIGKIADFEFKEKKFKMISCFLMIFISALFLIITVIIRSAYDLGWDMEQYLLLFAATQIVDMIKECFLIWCKHCIGSCCVRKPIPNSNKTNDGYQLMTDDISIHAL